MMPLNSTNMRFRCDPDLPLQDLPHDVFVNLCRDIDQSFITQTESVIFSSYRKVEELKKRNGSYDIQKAVFLLGDKEGWTVRNIVSVLMKINNQLALRRILSFWPPRITKPPPVELHLYPGRYVNVVVEMTGFPEPQVIWYNPDGEEFQEGAHLQLPGTAQPGQYCVVVRSWDPIDGSEFNDTAFFNLVSHQTPSHLIVVRPTYEQHWPESAHTGPVSAIPLSRNHQRMTSQPSKENAKEGLCTYSPPIEPVRMFGAIGKVALLVGMGTYDNPSYTPLAGPSQDLLELAERLARIDFRVFTLRDLALPDLVRAIDTYADLLTPGVYGLLYLSGHGVRFPGHNDDFLLPVDAPPDKRPEHCLSRLRVIAQLQRRRPQLNLVVWDACRESARDTASSSVTDETHSDYSESNLFEFRSSVAFTRSFELRRRSLIILPLLDILGDMSRSMNMIDLLTAWKEAVESSGLQTPAIMLGGPSRLSLWDPIVRRSGHTQQFFRILRLWSDGYDLDEKRVFPQLTINVNKDLTNNVSVAYKFLLHNELELQLESKVSGRAMFNLEKVRQRLFQCPVNALESTEHLKGVEFVDKVRISNLERLVSQGEQSPDGAHLTIPFSFFFRTAGGTTAVSESSLTIVHIRLLELFQQRLCER